MEMKIPQIMLYYWKGCWCFVPPITLALLLIIQFVKHQPYKSNEYIYPDNIQALGWLISLSSCMLIPAVAIYQVVTRRNNGKELGWALLQPTRHWGPPDATRRKFPIDQWWTSS